LRQLRDLTKDVFSNIGTEKSRQRLVYDLLNALKTNDRKRFFMANSEKRQQHKC